jgi:hypothetical protein
MGQRSKLNILPGITKIDSDYSQEGRWVDSNWIRWEKGLPEKMGGFEKLLEDETFLGKARGTIGWRSDNEVRNLIFGTHRKVYHYASQVVTDITPYDVLQSGTLSNALDTTNGDATVNVNHTGHNLKTGQVVTLEAGAVVGGLTIRGSYVVTVTGANDYTIEANTAASADVTGGGGTTSYEYHGTKLTDPFTTENGSPTVNVEHASHGRQVGDRVYFDDASAAGGITIDGEYVVASIVDADNYTITHTSNASSGATGGGTVTVLYDISIGLDDASQAFGYGVGTYGSGTYGTPRTSGVTLHSRTWTFDVKGEVVVGAPRGGRIYYWDPDDGGRMRLLAGAPTGVAAVFVTELGNVVALGGGGNKRAIDWSDDEDFTLWDAAATNTAESREIASTGELVNGTRLKGGVALIWTESACFQMRYTGDDFVYDIDKLSDNGLYAPHAFVEDDGIVYWVSDSDFYISTGTRPVPLKSEDIKSWFFDAINSTQRDKVLMGAIRKRNEIIVLFPSTTDEVDRYVKFNHREQLWDIGSLARTAWNDRIFDLPLGFGTDGYIYEHESGRNADGAAIDSYLKSAPFDIGDGDQSVEVQAIIPDFKDQAGTVDFYVFTKAYPNESETENGPFSATPSTTQLDDMRVSGRQAAIKVQSNSVDGHFRMGAVRLETKASWRR